MKCPATSALIMAHIVEPDVLHFGEKGRSPFSMVRRILIITRQGFIEGVYYKHVDWPSNRKAPEDHWNEKKVVYL